MNDALVFMLAPIGIIILLVVIWLILKNKNYDKLADKVEEVIDSV